MSDEPAGLLEACKRIKELKSILTEFADDIDATGGCTRDHKGHVVPMVDEEWIDIGITYVKACTALGRQPLITTSEGVE